jgi:hypothetical protein
VETSAIASIEDLLREHERHVAKERSDALRRAELAERARRDAEQRAVEEAARRAQRDEDERRHRVFEEQRREAEIVALQRATAERVRSEAEARARLAELAARQEHERRLHALAHDGSKRRWKLASGLVALAFVVTAGVGGYALHQTSASTRAAEAEAASLRARIADAEHDEAALRAQLLQATDPAEIAALRAQLAAKDATISDLERQAATHRGATGMHPTMSAAATGAPTARPTAASTCHCMDGDPTCSCIH